jgi:hypothetical protein
MLRIMSDNDVLGQVDRLIEICQAPWDEFRHQPVLISQFPPKGGTTSELS